MLHVKGDTAAHQQGQPADVHPDHKQNDDGKTGVDCIGAAVARRYNYTAEAPTEALKQEAGNDTGNQGGFEFNPGIGDKHVKEGEGANDHRVGRGGGQECQQLLHKGHVIADSLCQPATQHTGGKTEGGKHQQWPDQHHAAVVGKTPAYGAMLIETPDVVKGAFDFLNQRDGGVKQQCNTKGAKHANLHIVDKADDL